MGYSFNAKLKIEMDVTPANYDRARAEERGPLVAEAIMQNDLPVTAAHLEMNKLMIDVLVPTDVAVATLETRRVELQRKLEQKVEDLVKARV